MSGSPPRLTARIRLRRADDSGIAMVTAIGMGMVMTLLAVASLAIAVSNANFAARSRRSGQAFQTADEGFNLALSRIKNGIAGNSLRFDDTSTVNGATYSVDIERPDPSRPTHYTATSTSTTSSGERRTVRASVDSFSVWDFEFSGAGTNSNTNGSGAINGNVEMHGPFYVRGDFPVSGSSEYHGGPAYIKRDPSPGTVWSGAPNNLNVTQSGNLWIKGSSGVGDQLVSADCFGMTKKPVDVYAEGGIYPLQGSYYPGVAITNTAVIDLQLPLVDENLMDYYYSAADFNTDTNANPGAIFPGHDGIRNGGQSLTLDSSLSFKTINYTYQDRDGGASHSGGYFSWNYPPNLIDASRTLHIDGTVFVDGPLVIGDPNNQAHPINYTGRGTIVVNGPITINQPLKPADLTTFPASNVLGLVSNYTGTAQPSVEIQVKPSISLTGCDAHVAAAIFGKRELKVSKDTTVVGSLVGGSLTFANLNGGGKAIVYSHTDLAANLPPKLPGTDRVTQVVGYHELPDGAVPAAPAAAHPAQ